VLGTSDDENTLSMSAAVKLWASLLEGPWGRPSIFLDASWLSEARFTGLSGADALPESRVDSAAPADVADFALASELGGGAVLLRKKPLKPKRLRLAGDSIADVTAVP